MVTGQRTGLRQSAGSFITQSGDVQTETQSEIGAAFVVAPAAARKRCVVIRIPISLCRSQNKCQQDKDKDYFLKTTSQIIENRKFTEKELDKLGFETVSSTANFLLTKPKGISAKQLYLALKQKGVIDRYFDNSLISDYVRITVGSREQMEILIQKTKEVLMGGQNA